MTFRVLVVAGLFAACAPQKPDPEAPEQPLAGPAETATAPATSTPPPTSTPPTSGPPKPVPPLSSPNPSAKPTLPAGDDAGPASGDPRTETLRRIGVIGQRCHEKNTPGVNGNFTLEIALDADGKIEKTRVINARSTQALLGGAFERCVLDGVKKEHFPPPKGEDVVLDVPLSFKPGN